MSTSKTSLRFRKEVAGTEITVTNGYAGVSIGFCCLAPNDQGASRSIVQEPLFSRV
jgi:hypothetical protein